jgi:tetratricopeptide (TPR) repeat protein
MRMRRWISGPRLFVAVFAVLLTVNFFVLGPPWQDEWRGKARGHNNLGKAYQDAGRLVEAKQQYMIAMRKQPNYAHPYINMGTILELEGEYGEAVIMYRWALKNESDSAVARYNLGNCLVRLNQLDEAAGIFAETVRMGFAVAKSHNNLGYIRANQGRIPEAIVEFRAALKEDPAFEEPLKNILLLDARTR